jgi:stage II sporulation protein AB (anti-sigma F factor)
MDNQMEIKFLSKSENESFARIVACAFVSQLDPTTEEMADIKTAVSEAVTNAIIHGYEGRTDCLVTMCAEIDGDYVSFVIRDTGKGIENVERAMEPLFTTCSEEERSGMGFTVMESFMDDLEVDSAPGAGTTVKMGKKILHMNY